MRWLKPAIFATTSVVSFSASMPSLHASQASQPWTHYGLRPLGMGNAYVAVADDFNALFYNPAGLARLKTWDGELLNPAITATKNVNGLVKDAKNLKSGSTSDTLNLVEKNTGENFDVGLSLTPHLIFPNFGIGLGLDVSAQSQFHRDVTVDLDAGVRAVLPIAIAKSFFDDRLSIGVGIKVRARVGIDQNFSMDDIAAFQSASQTNTSGKKLDDYVKAGTGYGGDIGMLFTPQKQYEPTLGLSVTDIGGTPYKQYKVKDSTLGAPPIQLPSVNVGLSAKPIQGSWYYLMTAVDMHSINQPYSFSKKFNLGVEGGLGNILKIQTGVYQGYYTAGVQFDVGLFNLRLVTYAEELGNTAGFKEDRRIAAQLKFIL
ncbi:MAG: hypothetical protein H7249_10615 [Chitinophagaceae bacterium]|nr:hypothetical protein [Oligoflexus sp.]